MISEQSSRGGRRKRSFKNDSKCTGVITPAEADASTEASKCNKISEP